MEILTFRNMLALLALIYFLCGFTHPYLFYIDWAKMKKNYLFWFSGFMTLFEAVVLIASTFCETVQEVIGAGDGGLWPFQILIARLVVCFVIESLSLVLGVLLGKAWVYFWQDPIPLDDLLGR